MDATRTLDWNHGSVTVQRLGAMLAPVRFDLSSEQAVQPFHIARWAEDGTVSHDELATLPPILQRLRGEWPCVPFGADEPQNLAGDWHSLCGQPSPLPIDAPPHGPSSNAHWNWAESRAGRIALSLDYPDDHPIAWAQREITPDPSMTAIDLILRVMPRADCHLPIGLHPTFALPLQVGAARLITPQANHIRSYPGSLEPGAEIFAPNKVFSSLREAPARAGDAFDASLVPFEAAGEDLAQVVGVKKGEASLENLQAGYRVNLAWDAKHFPSLLLWFSNRGRQHAPWLGCHAALGMEPVCSAFDLGAGMSCGNNPIRASGTATAYPFRAGMVFETSYRIEVQAL